MQGRRGVKYGIVRADNLIRLQLVCAGPIFDTYEAAEFWVKTFPNIYADYVIVQMSPVKIKPAEMIQVPWPNVAVEGSPR